MTKPPDTRTFDRAEDGRCYVVLRGRLSRVCGRAGQILEAIRASAPTDHVMTDDLAATLSSVIMRGTRPVNPMTSGSIGSAARGPYLDPLLCRCEDMIAATQHRSVIDVSPVGTILYRVAVDPSDPLSIPADPWTLAGSFLALRHCPFDGSLMDVHVPARERGAVGEDGSPYCCAWLREAHALHKVVLTTSDRHVMAATLRFGSTPVPFWHCSSCGEKTILTNHARSLFYGHR